MKTIKIIEQLLIDVDGVKAKTKNGKYQTVHLRQGNLDGACSVYSTMMNLILIGAVKFSDIRLSGNNYDKRYGIERLKKEFFDLKGLHREGNYFYHEEFDNIKEMLQRSFSKHVSSTHIEGNADEIIDKIHQNINNNQPLLISIAYKGSGSHALVAVGVEINEQNQPNKILCLDPGCETPKFTSWNSIIDLKPQGGKYTFRNITETGDCKYVQLQDVLVISSK